MIRDICEIRKHNKKYIKDFIRNCKIEEKIDTHYITVEILSDGQIKFIKGNGFDVDRVDYILNSMWNQMFIDWQYLMLCNKQWFTKHIGYKVKMFYLPTSKPIETEYPEGLRYIIDCVEYNDLRLSGMSGLNDLTFPELYKVDAKRQLTKVDNVDELVKAIDEDDGIQMTFYNDLFLKLVKDKSEMYAIGEPEGIIFKWNNQVYQYKKNVRKRVNSEKTSYEFLLCHFLKFVKSNHYLDRLTNSYTKSVSNLFNAFIIQEQETNYLANNLYAESLEAPNIGASFDICYDYIPDPLTKQLCQNNVLYKNIYKILLANLRKEKDVKHCIFMNKVQVDDWNNVVNMIKARTVYI